MRLTRTILGLAAAIGREFRLDVLLSAGHTNEESTFRALDELWQKRIIHDQGVDAYQLRVGEIGKFDLTHLGLGPDGHTASLFPNTGALDETERFVVANGDDLHPHPRLTFTFPAIARSPLVVIAPWVFRWLGHEPVIAGMEATYIRLVLGASVLKLVTTALEQFFLGGPLYCDGCYEKAPTCDDCGWHINPDRVADHLRQAHHD